MTSTNEGKEVKINTTSGPKGKAHFIELFKSLDSRLTEADSPSDRTKHLCEAWRKIHNICLHSTAEAHGHLLSWLQRHTARVVLQTAWQKPERKDDRASLEEAINVLIVEAQTAAATRNSPRPQWEAELVERAHWYKGVLAQPWRHPVLTCLLNSGGTPPSDDEVLGWLKEERGITFVVRLQTLVAEKCDDIAVSLCAAVVTRVRRDQPEETETKDTAPQSAPAFGERLIAEAGFTDDVWHLLTDIEFVLLHKCDRAKCIALAKQTPLRSAYKLIERLQSRLDIAPRDKRLWKNCKHVAALIATAVITRCMMIPICAGEARLALYRCSYLLARLTALCRLPAAACALAAPASSAAHLHTLAQAIDAQLAQKNEVSMKPFLCELYVRAITAGMNELERLKLKTEMDKETRLMEQTLASWFMQLGGVLGSSSRFRCECALTAFSLHPAAPMLDLIQAAPPLPPINMENVLETSSEATNPEFGSWASDSRSQTNFVKTSETLKMKARQNQANVLSTAILNEGEGLGLSPELCQDITVLLSGPRIKTLSWDMDRELLLENCRGYLERTHGGTKAVTTELKYLNLNPNDFQYLPEEDEDENNMYYGIEKGYEHLVEQEPPNNEIWESYESFQKLDNSSTDTSEEFELPITTPRKKKNRKPRSNPEEDDPLSQVAETKRKEKKERPHSKERSKERKRDKSKTQPKTDPLALSEPVQNAKDEKKEKPKRERKKKEKVPRPDGSLSNLVGLKVRKPRKKKNIETVCQGKDSTQSITPQDILYDGQFSMDEMKSPRSTVSSDSTSLMYQSECTMANGQVGLSKSHQSLYNKPSRPPSVSNQHINFPFNPQSSTEHSKKNSPIHITDEIKNKVSKLLEFRRQKSLDLNRKISNTIIRTEGSPIYNNISPKSVLIPEIPKTYINKQQSDKLQQFKNEVDEIIKNQNSNAIPSPVIQYASSKTISSPSSQSHYTSTNKFNMEETPHRTYTPASEHIERPDKLQNVNYISIYDKNEPANHSHNPFPVQTKHNPTNQPIGQQSNVNTTDADNQDHLHDFHKQSTYFAEKKAPAKVIRPKTRVTPVEPKVKAERKTPQSAKRMPQKPEGSLNTFSRLNYYKNKQTEMRKPQEQQTLGSKLDGFIMEQLKNADKQNNETMTRNYDMPHSSRAMNHPTVASMLQNPSQQNLGTIHQSDQRDFLQFLRQNNAMPGPSNSPVRKHPSPSSASKPIKAPVNILTTQTRMHKPSDPLKQTEKKIKIISSSIVKPANTNHGQPKPSKPVQQKPVVEPKKQNIQTAPRKNPEEWENVMNAILQQKTPYRGPNALDIALNKSSFEKAFEESLKRPTSLFGSECTDADHISRIEYNTKELVKITKTKKVSATTSEETISITERKTHAVLTTELSRSSQAKRNTKTNKKRIIDTMDTKKPEILKQLKPEIDQNVLIEKLMQQNNINVLRTNTNILQIDNPSTVSMQNTNKPNNVVTHSRYNVPNNDKHINYTPKIDMNPMVNETFNKKSKLDVEKHPNNYSQFNNTRSNHDEPPVSGIPSEYDLLDELMDDDLIKEIGELSSDEENYNTAAPSCLNNTRPDKKPVGAVFSSSVDNIMDNTSPQITNYAIHNQNEISSSTSPQITNYAIHNQNEISSSNSKKLYNVQNWPKTIAKPSGIKILQYEQAETTMNNMSSNTCQSVTTQILTTPVQINAYNVNINQISVQPKVYIAAVPQPVPQPNVVLFPPNLVYENYTSVQSPVQNVPNLDPYIAVNVAPTVIYQAPEFVAPVVSPLIISSTGTQVLNKIPCVTTMPSNLEIVTTTSNTGYTYSNCEHHTEQNCPDIVEKKAEHTYSNCEHHMEQNCPDIVEKKAEHTYSNCEHHTEQNCPDIVEKKAEHTYSNCEHHMEQNCPDIVEKKAEHLTQTTAEEYKEIEGKEKEFTGSYDPRSKNEIYFNIENSISDVNTNKVSERKVLIEVQQKQTDEKIDCKRNQKSNNKDLYSEADKERLRKKRMAILNRNVSHFCGVKTIALGYSPLEIPRPLEKQDNDSKKISVVDEVSPTTLNNLQGTNKDIESPSTPDSFKENEIKTVRVTKILRSSNKLKTRNISVIATNLPEKKVNASAPTPIISDDLSVKSDMVPASIANANSNKKRVSKRICNKAKKSISENSVIDTTEVVTNRVEASDDFVNISSNLDPHIQKSQVYEHKPEVSPTPIPIMEVGNPQMENCEDDIQIEEIFDGSIVDPNKRKIRFKLANGKSFKGTISGSVSIESLLDNPDIKKKLMSNFKQQKKVYSMKINVPKEVINTTKYHSVSQPTECKPVETVNLLSDDEDEVSVQVFETEYGTFKINRTSSDLFVKHQNKLKQKCYIHITKLSHESITTVGHVLAKPATTLKTQNVVECDINKKLNIIDNSPSEECYVHIPKVSHDSVTILDQVVSEIATTLKTQNVVQVCNTNKIQNIKDNIPSKYVDGILKDLGNMIVPISSYAEPIVLTDDDSSNDGIDNNQRPSGKIHELKNMLLIDLGVADSLSLTSKSSDVQETYVTDSIDLTDDLELPDPLSDKDIFQDYKAIVNRKCFVKLFRCDYKMDQPTMPNDDISDEPKDPDVELTPRSRSASFSILKDFPVTEVYVKENNRSSPVMEMYELIANLNAKNHNVNNKTPEEKSCKTCECVSEWMLTKKTIRMENNSCIYFSPIETKDTEVQSIGCTSEWMITKKLMNETKMGVISKSVVPGLVTLVCNFIEQGDFVNKYYGQSIRLSPKTLKRKSVMGTSPVAKIPKRAVVSLNNTSSTLGKTVSCSTNSCSLETEVTAGTNFTMDNFDNASHSYTTHNITDTDTTNLLVTDSIDDNDSVLNESKNESYLSATVLCDNNRSLIPETETNHEISSCSPVRDETPDLMYADMANFLVSISCEDNHAIISEKESKLENDVTSNLLSDPDISDLSGSISRGDDYSSILREESEYKKSSKWETTLDTNFTVDNANIDTTVDLTETDITNLKVTEVIDKNSVLTACKDDINLATTVFCSNDRSSIPNKESNTENNSSPVRNEIPDLIDADMAKLSVFISRDDNDLIPSNLPGNLANLSVSISCGDDHDVTSHLTENDISNIQGSIYSNDYSIEPVNESESEKETCSEYVTPDLTERDITNLSETIYYDDNLSRVTGKESEHENITCSQDENVKRDLYEKDTTNLSIANDQQDPEQSEIQIKCSKQIDERNIAVAENVTSILVDDDSKDDKNNLALNAIMKPGDKEGDNQNSSFISKHQNINIGAISEDVSEQKQLNENDSSYVSIDESSLVKPGDAQATSTELYENKDTEQQHLSSDIGGQIKNDEVYDAMNKLFGEPEDVTIQGSHAKDITSYSQRCPEIQAVVQLPQTTEEIYDALNVMFGESGTTEISSDKVVSNSLDRNNTIDINESRDHFACDEINVFLRKGLIFTEDQDSEIMVEGVVDMIHGDIVEDLTDSALKSARALKEHDTAFEEEFSENLAPSFHLESEDKICNDIVVNSDVNTLFGDVKTSVNHKCDHDNLNTSFALPCNEIDYFKVMVPERTYSIINTYPDVKSKTCSKRRKDMSDIKISAKKYRKGKNIDYPKLTAQKVTSVAYAKEFQRIIDYCSTIKFSYARPFHIDYIDVARMHNAWPELNNLPETSTQLDQIESMMYTDVENKITVIDSHELSLDEEIANGETVHYYEPIDINERNFNMGFGEMSGRVIQKIETGNLKLSAATLSDVKQYQPLLMSEKRNLNINLSQKEENQKIKLDITNIINLKNKIRSSFIKTSMELTSELLQGKECAKNENNCTTFPLDLTSTEFFDVSPKAIVVNVVQVGQMPINSSAQNPVTCDPRVTHVSDASPSQCSDSSPGEEPQNNIETEYTELTNANIALPLEEYSHHQQTPQEKLDNTNGSAMSIVKIELMEEDTSQERLENEIYENDFSPLPNNHVEYSFEETSNNLFTSSANNESSCNDSETASNKLFTSSNLDSTFTNIFSSSTNIDRSYTNLETSSSIDSCYASMENASNTLYNTSSNVDNSSNDVENTSVMSDASNINETNGKSRKIENPYPKMYPIGRDTKNIGDGKNIDANNDNSNLHEENRSHSEMITKYDVREIGSSAYEYAYENMEDFAANMENNNNGNSFSADGDNYNSNSLHEINNDNYVTNNENFTSSVEGYSSHDYPTNIESFPNVERYEKNTNIDRNLNNISNPTVGMLEDSQPQDLSIENSIQEPRTFKDKDQDNGTSKPDQIAHAMTAAGISSEGVIASTPDELVSLISQGTQSNAPSYTKPAQANQQINVMTLQQALAHVLPPPLNQASPSENQGPNNTLPQQVLHIVQGNNAQSVINKPNGTHLLHIVQNKNNPASNGLSLVDAGLQSGNQLIHIVNNGNQNNAQFLKRVNLLTNLPHHQSNEQKMIQLVCKSADGKSIQLNTGPQRSMVLRLHPSSVPTAQKPPEAQDLSISAAPANGTNNQDQEIKSRARYEENYAQFVQGSTPSPGSSTSPCQEKSTSLPKFNQAFGKQSYQDDPKLNHNGMQGNSDTSQEKSTPHVGQPNETNNPPSNTPTDATQVQRNSVQQIKQTIPPMNIQTMHGGVIYTRQIPVNIGGGQTINLITVPSTEMVDEPPQKQQTDSAFTNQDEPSSIIKLVPHHAPNNQNVTSSESNAQTGTSSESSQNPPASLSQPQPVLTQMRIKLPMISKGPHIVPGTRLVRPSFFQIQRNVIAGTNQPVYQQLVLTTAPSLGQAIRLPTQQTASGQSTQPQPILVQTAQHSQPSPHIPVQQVQHAPTSHHTNSQQAHSAPPTPQPSSVKSDHKDEPESELSNLTLEQLREFDMVLEQVKERSVQPTPSTTPNSTPIPKPASADSTDGPSLSTASTSETTLYSTDNGQPSNVVSYVNRKSTITSASTSFARSPDSSGIMDGPSSSTHVHVTATVSAKATDGVVATPQPKKKKKKKPPSNANAMASLGSPSKNNSLKPQEDEQTTQRILYILAEYKEQVENSPDKNKPAPRRRNQFPPTTGSKRKRSHCSSRSACKREGVDMSPMHEHGDNGDDSLITLGSEDSSCGTTFSECTDCQESHSPEDNSTKVVRRLTFEHETTTQTITQTRTTSVPQRNVVVSDAQTITVARTTATAAATPAKPTTTVLMPANYLLPVSMIKGGQQIAIMTNRGPKILVGAGDTNALLFQRLIGPGLKPVLTRPGVRHIRLPATALHNLQTFNIQTTPVSQVPAPDSTAPRPATPAPPDLVDSPPWTDREAHDKPERGASPDCTEPWNLPSSSIADDYGYEEIVRTDNMERTVLDAIPDRYSPDMEAQRIFDKMFDVDTKKMYSPRCGFDIDTSDGDDRPYPQVVQKGKDGRHHRVTHVSTAALRHKYAILEHELRLQKSLSEECEDLGVDSPSASDLFPEADILFGAPSPAHEQTIDQCNTPPPIPMAQTIPQPEHEEPPEQVVAPEPRDHLDLSLDDVGEIVTVGEDGVATIPSINAEEFARSHPNTTFHTEPQEGEITITQPPFTLAHGLKRHITFHTNRVPGAVVLAPHASVISQAAAAAAAAAGSALGYSDLNIINTVPTAQGNVPSALLKDKQKQKTNKEPGTSRQAAKVDAQKEPAKPLSKFDSLLHESKLRLNQANTRQVVHPTGHGAQVIRRLETTKKHEERPRPNHRSNSRFHFEEPRPRAAQISEEVKLRNDRAIVESMGDNASSPGQPELFWDSERPEKRYNLNESDKVAKSPFDELLNDCSAYGPHTRLDSVIKAARPERTYERTSFEGINVSSEDRPLRTYPPKRPHTQTTQDTERHFALKTTTPPHSNDQAKSIHHDSGKNPRCHDEGMRRTGRGMVKRSCSCCSNGSSSTPPKKRSRPKKPKPQELSPTPTPNT